MLETKIINDFYDLIKWFMPKTAKFPRNYRYTLGEMIERFLFDMLNGLIKAKFTKDRKNTLTELNIGLESLRYYVRLCHDLQMISSRSYENSSKQINNIGMQLGGWIREQNKYA